MGFAENLFLPPKDFVANPAALQQARGPISLDGPIGCMLEEHNEAGTALERLRALSHGFQSPPDACNTYRALFAGLEELETDLHLHIHLENSVLFPQAKQLVAQTPAR